MSASTSHALSGLSEEEHHRQLRRALLASTVGTTIEWYDFLRKIIEEERVERVPVLEVFRRQPKQVLLTALLRLPEQAPG